MFIFSKMIHNKKFDIFNKEKIINNFFNTFEVFTCSKQPIY